MDIRPGTYVRSTGALDSSFFEGALIYIVEHNEKGSIGFVVNKPDGRYLNQLQEFADCPAVPLYEGGPVDHEHLYLLHSRPDLIQGSSQVEDGMYWGGDMRDVASALKAKRINKDELKIFIGYCGWDADELSREIAEGSWQL